MLGIKRNRYLPWHSCLRMLPLDFLGVISFGYLKSYNWFVSLIHFGTDLVVVLSFGHLDTNWGARYWNARNR